MPSPSTTGGSLMSSPSTVDTGGVPPLIISTDIPAIQGIATSTLTANAVYLYQFDLAAQTTFTGAKWKVGATATGTADIGIYDFATGTKQASLGATTNTAATSMTANFSGGNITLPAGSYFAALTLSNATDTIVTEAVGAVGVMSHFRQATNTGTSGVLPTTLGGYSDSPTRVPAFALTVLNGLT